MIGLLVATEPAVSNVFTNYTVVKGKRCSKYKASPNNAIENLKANGEVDEGVLTLGHKSMSLFLFFLSK